MKWKPSHLIPLLSCLLLGGCGDPKETENKNGNQADGGDQPPKEIPPSLMLKIQDGPKKTKTKVALVELSGAIQNYKLEYNRHPIASGYEENTVIVFDGSAAGSDLLLVLMGENSETIRNPRQQVFFDAEESDGKSAGVVFDPDGVPKKLLDPWGQPIKMIIDHDYDNKISHPQSKKPIAKSSLAWSDGSPNDEDEADEWANNITSWN